MRIPRFTGLSTRRRLIVYGSIPVVFLLIGCVDLGTNYEARFRFGGAGYVGAGFGKGALYFLVSTAPDFSYPAGVRLIQTTNRGEWEWENPFGAPLTKPEFSFGLPSVPPMMRKKVYRDPFTGTGFSSEWLTVIPFWLVSLTSFFVLSVLWFPGRRNGRDGRLDHHE